MTENNEVASDVVRPDGGAIDGGIAILPKTDKRPIAIVGMGTDSEAVEQVKLLSERLGKVGMEHVLLSMEDAEKEGITKEDLLSAQLEQSQTDGLLGENPIFGKTKNGGGSKAQQKFKRKKKGKKTHRKKR